MLTDKSNPNLTNHVFAPFVAEGISEDGQSLICKTIQKVLLFVYLSFPTRFESFEKIPRFQGSKVSRLQSFKASKFQGFKVPRFQGSKVSRLQGFKVSRLQGFKVPSF